MTEFDHLAPEPEKQFVSLGYLCGLLQVLPGQLKVLMEDCKINFSMVLDGVGYLTVADAERVADKCREVRDEIDSALTSHERN